MNTSVPEKDKLSEIVLDARGIRVEYRRRTGLFRRETIVAVRDANVEVQSSRTLGVVGESGCGKSSLGRVLLGIQQPTRGRLEILGSEVTRGWIPTPLRLKVQAVFQDPRSSLNPRRRIIDSLSKAPVLHGLWPRSEARERARCQLDRVALDDDTLDKYPHQLSGGQLQRVAIARALALEPALLVCDEPVTSLDVSIQAGVMSLLRELKEREGIAYVFIAHDLAVVEQISDEVCVMYLGSIVERGPAVSVFTKPVHPYTQALLKCHPSPEPVAPGAGPALPVLSGEIPSPANPPPGCSFHTRCPLYRQLGEPAICRKEEPMLPGEGGAACHFTDESSKTHRPDL